MVKDNLISNLGILKKDPENNDLYEFSVYSKSITGNLLKDENQLLHISFDTSVNNLDSSVKYSYD